MSRRIVTIACAVCFSAFAGVNAAEEGAALKPSPPSSGKPEVAGKWTGIWGPYDPAKGMALEKEQCKQLDCTVAFHADTQAWEATFEGECGRPYKYVIKMHGRQAESVVLFKGTVDLGPKDGGVYDWVGRANADEFAGFYTSAHYIGVFRLRRASESAVASE